MQLREIAAISGRPGLFRILKPTHSGVIVEVLDGSKAREAVGASQRLSILSEISMYTTTEEGSEPLGTILHTIFVQQKGKKLGLSAKSDGAELETFFATVLPNWDPERVYLSDIKKLVTWYNLLIDQAPDALVPAKEEEKEGATKVEEVKSEEVAAKEASAPKPKKAKVEAAAKAPTTAEEAPAKKTAPKKKKEIDL
jgi:hypothetical protein